MKLLKLFLVGITGFLMGLLFFVPYFGNAQLRVLQVNQGGTGAATFNSGECLIGNGTGAITTTSCGGGGGGGGAGGWDDNGVRVNLSTNNDLVEIGAQASTTIGAQLSVTSTTTAAILFGLKGAAGQDGDFLRILDSNSNILTRINAAGGLAISGTTTPGVSLHASSTIFSASTTVYGLLSAGVLQSTTTATSTFGGGLWVNGGGLASAAGLTITGGNIQSNGNIDLSGTATSTWAGGLIVATGGLNTNGLTLSGTIKGSSAGTSTLAGGIDLSAGCFAINGVCVGGGGGSGTVTSITAGGGLTGGIITTSGTIALDLTATNAWTSVSTTTFAGGISVAAIGGLTSASGLTLTGGNIQSSGNIDISTTATSTWAGGLQVATDGLNTTGLLVSGNIRQTNAGTSTFTGGISVGTGGLHSATGLTISGGSIESAGVIDISAAATSTWSGGLILATGGLSTNGLTLGGTIRQTTTGTSTFTGGLSVSGLENIATTTSAGLRIPTGGIRLATLLNCNGNSTLDTDADGNIVCGADGGGSAYATIQNEGSNLTQRVILNFIGAGVDCVDDGADSTDCTIAGGGGGSGGAGGWDDNGVRINLTTNNDLVEIGATATTTIGAALSVTSTTTSAILFGLKGVANQRGDYFRIQDSSDNRLLTINAAGGLGIGTTSPGFGLSVATTSGFTASSTLFAGLITPHIAATSTLNFYVGGGAPRMIINSSGAVGIGTTSPVGSLNVADGGFYTNQINFVEDSSEWIQSLSGTGIDIGTGNVARITILDGGNVGIATDTPGAILSVSGATLFSHATSTILGGILTPVINASGTQFTISTGGLSRATIAATSTFRDWIISNSGIGIGTSTPYGALGVVGNIGLNGQFFKYFASTTGSAAYIINWNDGNDQRIILNQNATIVVNSTSSNPRPGNYSIKFCQDSIGSRTITWIHPDKLIWWNGTTTINPNPNGATWIGMKYDNRTQRYDIIASSTKIDYRSCLP